METNGTQSTPSSSSTTNLDLAFILDCTDSMSVYIDHAKENIHLIANEIIQTENCSLHIGLIEYRDHPPMEDTFVTRVHNFTDNIELARKFISQCTTNGGGDVAESICCGLSDCLNKLEWRDDSVKLAILITDGPPHGLIGVFDDYFPKGCPVDSKQNDPVQVAHRMAEKAITLYCAGCEPSLTFYRPFFIPLTLITGGQYIVLDEADSLSNIIIGGSHEEIFMEKFMDQVNNEVLKESVNRIERPLDEEELTMKIHFILNSNSNERKHKRHDHHLFHATPRQKFNEDMRKMSNLKTLGEFNKYILDNDVRISPSNFFIDTLDPLSIPNEINFDPFSTSKSKKISNSKRRKNNSDSDVETNDKRTSSPENSSPDSQDPSTPAESSSESMSGIKNSMDASNSNSSSSYSNSSFINQSTSSSFSSSSGHMSSSSFSSTASSNQSMSGNSSTGLSTKTNNLNLNVTMDQSRRLVKKSMARNKLNKK